MISDEFFQASSNSGTSENGRTFENSKYYQHRSMAQGTSQGEMPLGIPSAWSGIFKERRDDDEDAKSDQELLDRSEELIGQQVESEDDGPQQQNLSQLAEIKIVDETEPNEIREANNESQIYDLKRSKTQELKTKRTQTQTQPADSMELKILNLNKMIDDQEVAMDGALHSFRQMELNKTTFRAFQETCRLSSPTHSLDGANFMQSQPLNI